MTIEELLKMEHGSSVGDFNKVIKTAKKKWQDEKDDWVHQVLLADKTGEILADVYIVKYNPLRRAQELIIDLAYVQDAPDGKKLLIEKFHFPTSTEPHPIFDENWELSQQIVRSKIKCLLVQGMFAGGAKELGAVLMAIQADFFKQIIDEIMKG